MNNKNKKKKNPVGTGMLVFGLLAIFSALADAGGKLMDDDVLIAIVSLVIVVVAAIAVAVKTKKKKAGAAGRTYAKSMERPAPSVQLHSHDRLHQTEAVRCSDGYDHWINQLNGFLSAGLIDRAEYKVLMRKHPPESFKRLN